MKQLALFAIPRFKYLAEHIYRGSDGYIHIAFKSTKDLREAEQWMHEHCDRGFTRIFLDDRNKFTVIASLGTPGIVNELNETEPAQPDTCPTEPNTQQSPPIQNNPDATASSLRVTT